ncbi:hypothetical protein C8R43DRAFT_994014 [Mycena crocata]|nr:hypothetical protein C8R43DRAFT_994014 [Mycena crocata]
MAASEKSARAADRAHVTDLEAQVLHLERTIHALRSDIKVTKARLDAYKYPVLTLPYDIISKIFIDFLPVYPLCPPLAGPLSPTLLTHVCRTWKEVAMSIPPLWRAISFSVWDFHLQDIQIMESWLGRSGRCPLSVSLDLRSGEIPVAIIAHRKRVEYAHLQFHKPAQLLSIADSMPLLQGLDISCRFSAAPPIVIHEVPRLRTVTLDSRDAEAIVLPWAQLTSLTFICDFPQECARILKQTPSLVRCILSIRSNGQHQQPDIRLPRLESLTLFSPSHTNETVEGCLDIFIVPALRSLRVQEAFLSPNPIASLESFISRSTCRLQKLRISERISVTKDAWRAAFPSTKVSFPSRLWSNVSTSGGEDHDE